MDDVLTQHLAYGALSTYAIEFLKKAKWFPFLTDNSAALSRVCSVVASVVSSAGITAAATGHLSFDTGTTVTLVIPSISVMVTVALHSVGQFVIQQGVYHGLVKKADPNMTINNVLVTGAPAGRGSSASAAG